MSALHEAADAIIGVCNSVLLRNKPPITQERLFSGELGSKQSYLHAVVLPALSHPEANEETFLLASVAANFVLWQAIMRSIVVEPVFAEVIDNAKIRCGKWSQRKARRELKQQIVADAFAVGIGKELYVHPHNNHYLYAPAPQARRTRMLQALTATAGLAAKADAGEYWVRVRLIAALRSWERDIGAKTVAPLVLQLKQNIAKSDIHAAQQLVSFARVDTEAGGTDTDLSLPIYDTPPLPGQQTATNLIVPERRKRVMH